MCARTAAVATWPSVFALPVSAPSERTTIEPEVMRAAESIASALATASKMWVPVATLGWAARAAEILVAEVVRGSTVFACRLNSISPSCSFGLRRAAKACSAATAAASGFPRMLQLVSSTSTTPNVLREASLAGTRVVSTTEVPFSVIETSWTVSLRPLGSDSTSVRTGKGGPFASTRRSPEPPAEEAERQRDAALLELLQERRPQAGGPQGADDRAVAGHLVDPELEQLLQGDHVGLHALHLDDRGDPAGAVLEPLEVDDPVEGRGDLLADGAHGQVVAGHQDHRLHAGEGVAGAVGVDGGERAVVTRVHRLQHVERLGAAHLADDDPVGPHAQRVAHQGPDRHLVLAGQVLGAGLEAQHVLLVQP